MGTIKTALALIGAAITTLHPLARSLHAGTAPPADMEELKSRIAELKIQYAPFLRSLPEKKTTRTRVRLSGGDDWKRIRIIHKKDSKTKKYSLSPVGSEPSDDFDDSKWKNTSVPEWLYETTGNHRPVNCELWYRKKFEADPIPSGKRVFIVFDGVDWQADVWLNGKKLGTHKGYYGRFRFDVTDILKKNNLLAVRVLDGRAFGEPCAHWPPLYTIPADTQRYTRDKRGSIQGYRKHNYQSGSGHGIHRDVWLETTGEDTVAAIFARGYPANGTAVVKIETTRTSGKTAELAVEIIPENFEGPAASATTTLESGAGTAATLRIPVPKHKDWTPETPYLYRVRATLSVDGTTVDSMDAIFGFRSFAMVSEKHPSQGFLPGTFLLNGEPILLKGTNVMGLNMFWYWKETEKLVDTILMLKAANFNAIRSCQHVMFPEVLELLDRLGVMSEQDQGARFPKGGEGENCGDTLLEVVATALAKETYNNPGVVLISYANETVHHPKYLEMIDKTLAFDPERIIVPISGIRRGGHIHVKEGRNWIEIPGDDPRWASILEDYHPYWGWYKHQLGEIWDLCHPMPPAKQLSTVGEYGAEALDSYETMEKYPERWGATPARTDDTLWGEVQLLKRDRRQFAGFRGRYPENLGQYIEASQRYQADVVGALTKCWRLSPKRVSGYFQFHFIDALPASWPKAIVSFDLTPKQAYYEMARVNQDTSPLPLINEDGTAMAVWIANDKNKPFENATLKWKISSGGKPLVEGGTKTNVKPFDAENAATVPLDAVPKNTDTIDIDLTLTSENGDLLGEYERKNVYIKAWREKDAIFPEDSEATPKKDKKKNKSKDGGKKKDKKTDKKKDKKKKKKGKKVKDKENTSVENAERDGEESWS
jgi:hypothetical protein